jgi:hypothetical protein
MMRAGSLLDRQASADYATRGENDFISAHHTISGTLAATAAEVRASG